MTKFTVLFATLFAGISLTSAKTSSTEVHYTLHYPNGTTIEETILPGEPLAKLEFNDNSYCFMGWYTTEDFAGAPQLTASDTVEGVQDFWAMTLSKDSEGWCLISNADELYRFAAGVNLPSKNFPDNASFNGKLTADIVVNENVLDSNGNLNKGTFRTWTPIGEKNHFTGSFDGNGHTISGLYEDTDADEGSSAFILKMGNSQGSTPLSIRNLGIKDSYFKGYNSAAGLVVYAYGNPLTIENSFFEGTVIATDLTATGLIEIYHSAQNDFTMNNCHFKGKVIAEEYMANGIVYLLDVHHATISNTYVEGEITADNYAYGIGDVATSLTIANVYCTAKQKASYHVAFIGAILQTGTIINSYTTTPFIEFFGDDDLGLTKPHLDARTNAKLEVINSYLLYDGPDMDMVYTGLTVFPLEKFEDGTVANLLQQNCTYGVCGTVWGQDVQKGETYPSFSGIINKANVPYSKLTLHTYDTDPNAKHYPSRHILGYKQLLPSADEVKQDGYYFAGWYKSSNFKGTPLTEIDSTETNDVTLYAKFVPAISVTLVEYEGKTEKISAGKGIRRKLSRPTREGYVFAGWYKNQQFSGDMQASVVSEKDISLYAKWIELKDPSIKNGCYQISNVEELYGFASYNFGSKIESDACVELTEDIVVNKNVLKKDGSLNDSLKDGFAEWAPISPRHLKSFNGNGHTISGLYFNIENAFDVGFFTQLDPPFDDTLITLSNLRINDSYFRGKEAIGGIAGRAIRTTMTNCSFEGTLDATENIAGGLVGVAYETINIINSYHIGSVTAKYHDATIGAFVGTTSIHDFKGTGHYRVTNSYHAGDLNSPAFQKCDFNNQSCGIFGEIIEKHELQMSHVFTLGEIPATNNKYSEGVKSYSINKFKDGTVATLLHNYKSENTDASIWGQASDRAFPDFSGSIDVDPDSYTTAIKPVAFTSDSPFSIQTLGKNIQINKAALGQRYTLFDMQGGVLHQGNVSASNFELNIPHSGNYILRIGNKTRQVNVK